MEIAKGAEFTLCQFERGCIVPRMGTGMFENDEYRANLAVCRRMADKAQNEREKRAWLEMAESWRLLIICDDVIDASEFFAAAPGQGMGSARIAAARLRRSLNPN